MYVISEDSSGNLIETTTTIKQNLKTWLSRHKMVGDTIDILDARILNFGIEFTVIADSSANKTNVLDRCTRAIKEAIADVPYEIGEPVYISDLFKVLNFVDGVTDTVEVRLLSRIGGNYSD